MARLLPLQQYVDGVRQGNGAVLARAITLVESQHSDHRDLAQQLLLELLPFTGDALRLGISGVPGVGKSTFIEAMGSNLTADGHRVAVLAVDPSSSRTGGSILGDKTRMAKLANDPAAFVRPSPTAGTLGGVARATRETIVLMEAAGYDVVLVETVGVGQSEYAVAAMVDCFLLLSLARTGDSLQGIKKGVLELADVVAVNKADGDHVVPARQAARELAGAMHLMAQADSDWQPPVLTCSGETGDGLPELWETICRYHRTLSESGSLARKRQQQQLDWTWAMVADAIEHRLRTRPQVKAIVGQLEPEIRSGTLPPGLAAARILQAFWDADDQPAPIDDEEVGPA